MREGQKRVNVYLPEELYSRVLNSEYNITEAIITGLTNLLERPREDFESKADTNSLVSPENPNVANEINASINAQGIEEYQRDITGYKENIKSLNSEIERLKNVIQEAPDPLELARLQERNEGFKLVIAEKEKRIEDLTREVSRLDMFAHYFKTAEVKQIEAPATEKVKPWWKFW